MAEKDRTGEWVFDLYKDGAYFAQRSITSGEKTAMDAVAQWKRSGYVVKIIRRPKAD